MATNKPRFSVTFTDDSFDRIREFQKKNNISTQSKAVAQLVELALDAIDAEGAEEESSDIIKAASDEGKLILMYRELNGEGQEKLLDYADDLVASGKYIKNGQVLLGGEKMA